MTTQKRPFATQQLQTSQALVGLSENSLVIDHLKSMIANKANLDPLELADRVNDRIEGEGKEDFLLGLKESSSGLYNSIMQTFAAARVLSKQLQAQQQNAHSAAPPKPGFGPGAGGPYGNDDQ